MSTKHTVKLSQGAVHLLRSIVDAPGWAKSTSDIIVGGGLLSDDRLPEYKDAPTDKTSKEESKAWLEKAASPFEITEKEREAIKRAIEHFTGQGNIKASKYSAELLKAFGFE